MKDNSEFRSFPQAIIDYIIDHENVDPYKLALKKSPFPDTYLKMIVQQVQGRQVAKRKFPFLLNFDQYQYPVKESLEQASSELLAKFKSAIIKGESLVDLTGGMGIDTYILGQNFEKTTYIEPNTELYKNTIRNFKVLNFSNCTGYNTTCENFISTNNEKFDWAYIDPSRRVEGSRKISISNYTPNIVTLYDELIKKADNILVKLSPMQDIYECVEVLQSVVNIWVISVQNEVKELLLHVKNEENNATPEITAIDISKDGKTKFSHSFYDRNSNINISDHKRYIYQPGSALVKSELHNRHALEKTLSKLHPNTHLYTSDHKISNYFGKTFEVRHSLNLNKKELKQVLPEMKANVITKNFPLSPTEVAQKLKLKPGGDTFLIAYTGKSNKKKVVVCDRID